MSYHHIKTLEVSLQGLLTLTTSLVSLFSATTTMMLPSGSSLLLQRMCNGGGKAQGGGALAGRAADLGVLLAPATYVTYGLCQGRNAQQQQYYHQPIEAVQFDH